MDRVPAYLLVYFCKIKKHSEEGGYLYARIKDMDIVRATDEVAMLSELRELHLIGLSENKKDVVYNPLQYIDADGALVHRVGTEMDVPVPLSFVTLARGHYIWTEIVCDSLIWLLTAFIGAIIALIVHG